MEETRFPDLTEKLRKLRPVDMSQEQFAKHLGISRAALSNYESGKRIPDALMLKTIAQKCDVSADLLLGISHEAMTDKERQILASEYTGLSLEAVEKIHQYAWMRKYPHYAETLDCVNKVINKFYDSFLDAMGDFLNSAEMFKRELEINEEDKMEKRERLSSILDFLRIELFAFNQMCNRIPRDLFDSEKMLDNLESEIELTRNNMRKNFREGNNDGKYQ